MTPSEMEHEIKNLNEFVGELRHMLPLLATKEDLKAFATKEDLKRFATKEELREEVADARRYALMLNEATRDDIRLLAESMVAMQAQLSGMQTQLDRIERRLP